MRPTRLAVCLLLISGWTCAAFAQPVAPARMVVDLVESSRFWLFPWLPISTFRELGDAYLFPHEDGIHGAELWRTDGTTQGTWMVKDVCPGACMGVGSWDRHVHDGLYYFPGNDAVHGMELWVSDGTPQGTRMVADLAPGGAGSEPVWIQSLPNRLFWSAQHPEGGRAVWTLDDGEPASVFRTESSVLGPLITLDDKLLFVADERLWVTNSSLATSELRHDVLSLAVSTYPTLIGPRQRVVHDGRLFFDGRTDAEGGEPWVSDGTPEGTLPLGDVLPGTSGSLPRDFLPLGDEVLFRALNPAWDWEMWAVDSTSGVLRRVFDLAESEIETVDALLASDGSRALFLGRTTETGAEPWVTDGTAAGTHFVKDIRPGPESSLESYDLWYLPRLPSSPGRFFFAADDGVHGLEPWITDGTEEGTTLLADVGTGPSWDENEVGSFQFLAGEVTWTGSDYLFVAQEGASAGKEPWTSDGTPSGTRKITDLFDQSSAFQPCFFPLHHQPCPALVPMGEQLFFAAGQESPVGDASGWQPRLHVTNGGPASTKVIPFHDEEGDELHVYATTFDPPAVAGTRLVLKPGSFERVWSTDGTEEGNLELVDFTDAGTDPYPWIGPLVTFADEVVFPANGNLWQTDGTPVGTLDLGAPSSNFGVPTGSWPNRYLVASDGLYWATPGEIWTMAPGLLPIPLVSLPGDAVPELMGRLTPPPDADSPVLLFFWHDDGVTGSEPWVLESGEARRLLDVRAGPSGSRVRYPRDINTEDFGVFRLAVSTEQFVFFVADDGASGPTLWRTDGSAAGSFPLSSPDGAPLRPLWLTGAGDRIFFAAEAAGHGRELWVSDGSHAGTRMLEIVPGEGASVPRELVMSDDVLVFSAFHPTSGVELWTSDGTPSGTLFFQDLNPGPGSSSPTSLTVGGGRLWLTANDGVHGFELWVAPLDDAIFADGFESGGPEAWSLTVH